MTQHGLTKGEGREAAAVINSVKICVLLEGDDHRAYQTLNKQCAGLHFHPKVLFYLDSLWILNHCWNAQTSVFLLAVRSVAQRNDDFAAITSWCWGYERGASEELLTVHWHPVIGVMPADSVYRPSKDWVSRTFDRVTTHRPGFPPSSISCRSTWCFFVFPHHHFHGHDAPCFTDWAFSPRTGVTSHLQVNLRVV